MKALLKNLKTLERRLSSYVPGDVIALAEIRELLGEVRREFERTPSLKKLEGVLVTFLQISDRLASDPGLEAGFVELLSGVVSDLILFFTRKIEAKTFAAHLRSFIPRLKEMLSSSAPREEKGRPRYPSDYFDALVDDGRLLSQFFHEASDHLNEAQYTLLDLEYDPTNKELVNDIFRNFHTIKGSSAFLGLRNIEEVSHRIEDLFVLVRDDKIFLSRDLIDVVFYGIELIRVLLDIMETSGFEREKMTQAFLQVDIFTYLHLMERILTEYTVKKIGEILQEEGKLKPEDLHVLLERQEKEGGERMPLGKLAVEERLVMPEDVVGALKKQQDQRAKARRLGYVKVSNEKLNMLIDLVGELVIHQSMLQQHLLAEEDRERLDRTLTSLETTTSTIKNLVLSLGMLPMGDLFNRLRVAIRHTAEELGKAIIVDTEGEETELDRNMLEVLYDPLLHLVRNAVDHGIESPEEREKAGKLRVGKISLRAEHRGSGIQIVVEDDGRGIDRKKVVEKALLLGLVRKEDAGRMSEKEVYDLLFLPGFSTKERVDTTSGRGVGMDVVKKNLESIHGRVEVESEEGKFTRFIIGLPLTLAIIDGLVTVIGKNRYIFPFGAVEEIAVIPRDRLRMEEDQNATLLFHRGRHIPVLFSHRILGEERHEEGDSFLGVLVLHERSSYCVVVDEIVGKQEVVIKNLGGLLSGYRYLSGGTIFGDGSIGFVLDIQGLIEEAEAGSAAKTVLREV